MRSNRGDLFWERIPGESTPHFIRARRGVSAETCRLCVSLKIGLLEVLSAGLELEE